MKPRALCLAGPTAAGKTAVALAFAARHAAEIVSVDSALVYRAMDIGTAKPSAAERAAVPHHLVDIVEPTEPYSAARFVADANRLIGDIRARGRVPLLVGGTMLYFKALREGLDEMPSADPGVRAALDERAAREGWPALHAELARVDPATAARLAPNDAQRIQRALEVFEVSGRPLSAWHRAGRATAGDLPLVSLEPASRAWLHARIAERFDAMLAAGFVEEVKALRARGDLRPDLPSMRCVGYRQAWAALEAGDLAALRDGPASAALRDGPASAALRDGPASAALRDGPARAALRDGPARASLRDGPARAALRDGPARASLRDAGIAATRQLAKRQLTWLRSMNPRLVVPADAPDALARALAALEALEAAC